MSRLLKAFANDCETSGIPVYADSYTVKREDDGIQRAISMKAISNLSEGFVGAARSASERKSTLTDKLFGESLKRELSVEEAQKLGKRYGFIPNQQPDSLPTGVETVEV